MIQFGKSITSGQDKLEKVLVERIYHALINPKPEITSLIRQLRIVATIDKKQYNNIKKQLPYIVCGIFNPQYRKTENFGYIQYFIIDIDHITENNIDISILKQRLSKDNRVFMCFESPSQNGLKILFKLQEKCYDAGKYKLFYKAFTKKLALEYNLTEVIDGATCDVTRACFISIDLSAHYNTNADLIDINSYVNFEDYFEVKEIQQEIIEEKKAEKELSKGPKPELDNKIIEEIKKQLQVGRVKKEKPPVNVPIELELIMNDLTTKLAEVGINLMQVVNIQYGKQLKLQAGTLTAEINIFYGKRGYSVVQSSKAGTSFELNQLAAECISQFLFSKPELPIKI